MNALIASFVALLALASGKPFVPFPLVYQAGVIPSQVPQFGSFPHSFTSGSIVPVFKDASGNPVAPAITPVSFQYPFAAGNAVPFFKSATGAEASAVVFPQNNVGVQNFVVPFSKYHAQGDDGSYTFAYSGGPSSKTETRDQFGNIQGAFNYIDPTGKVQTQQYVADAQGFRVAATNLPLAPIVDLQSPKPVEETEEVKQARLKRTKREADPAFISATTYNAPANTAPLPVVTRSNFPGSYFAVPQSVPFFPSVYASPNAVPVTYSASGPAPPLFTSPGSTFPVTYSVPTPLVYASSTPQFTFKPGTLTKIVHNPGHAVSYRVDV